MEAQAGTGSNSGFPAFVFVAHEIDCPSQGSRFLIASPQGWVESLKQCSICLMGADHES
jgi:hypothetical protein